jgi:hypothetical protein
MAVLFKNIVKDMLTARMYEVALICWISSLKTEVLKSAH